MNNLNVFISILNWNSWQDCINCVRSLEQLETDDLKVTIGIADNASPNDSVDKLKKALPKYEILQLKTNLGYAAGHAANLKKAQEMNADFFWILNTDVSVTPYSLKALINAYEDYGNHIYGSVTLNEDDTIDFAGVDIDKQITKDNLEYNSGKLWKSKEYKQLLKANPDARAVHTLEGSSLFIPLNIIDIHGFMKTDFFMYGEESDYCLQLRRKGIQPYVVTKSAIYHHNEGSLKDCVALKAIPAYYRRRNFLRISIENFGMTRKQALRFNSGIVNNLKTILIGFLGSKSEGYYYALGSLHACIGIKGKIISPEKLYLNCMRNHR